MLLGSDGEHLMVIRTHEREQLVSLARRMSRMRDAKIKELGKLLEGELNE